MRATSVVEKRANDLFELHRQSVIRRTDRLFAGLMVCQWLAGVGAALWISPRTWAGTDASTHLHVWAAVVLGGLITTLPVALAILRPGSVVTRHTIAVGQMLASALLIHLTGGRIETHFHVFGSLAFLAFYRDWRVLISASVVVAIDHFARGVYWPQSVYGVIAASQWRWLEHAGWVVFENLFLAVSCVQGVREMRDIATRQSRLEFMGETFESEVLERTAELRASEERFRSLSGSSPVGIFQTDAAGRLTYANLRWQELSGLSLSDSTVQDWIRAVHPEDRPRVLAAWERAVEDGHEFECEFRFLARDGVQHWVIGRAAVMFTGDRTWTGLVGTVEDITAHKRTETQLLEKSAALENAVEGISLLDTEGRYLTVNSAYARMLGYEAEELPGREWRPTVHPEDRPRVMDAYSVMLAEGRVELDARGLRKDGTVFHKRVSMIKAYDPNGKFVGHYCFTKDITEQKLLEEQLRQSQKMEAVGQLAGGVAHDFNNLLTVILGYGEAVLRRGGLDDKSRTDVQEIRKSGQRAAALTRQLLAFSRRQLLTPVTLDLNDLVANMDKMLRRLIGENIDLLSAPDRELHPIKADPGQIEQVIMNLVVNARDAMLTGGKLTIETRNVVLDDEYVARHTGVQPGPHVMLAVTDNGVGMTEEVQARLFEPFFTTKERGKGTGLGLATVYGIVKQSGGSIQVYTHPGRGTTFKVYLPSVPSAVVAAASDTLPLPQRGQETVLLVEDEDAVRQLARRSLEENGYRVLDCEHGEQALAVWEEKRGTIDLLLTDVVMPGMSGPELAGMLVPLQAGMRVIYMSGYTDRAFAHQGLLEKGTFFLQKPFAIDALLHTVREVLDLPSSGELTEPKRALR